MKIENCFQMSDLPCFCQVNSHFHVLLNFVCWRHFYYMLNPCSPRVSRKIFWPPTAKVKQPAPARFALGPAGAKSNAAHYFGLTSDTRDGVGGGLNAMLSDYINGAFPLRYGTVRVGLCFHCNLVPLEWAGLLKCRYSCAATTAVKSS